jgi:hypothetical protein
MILRWHSAISLFTCSCLISVASATESSIGIVMTTGVVEVDGLQVPNTSAIFPGNLILSEDRSASLQFLDGADAVMRPGATMSVYRDYSVLRKGVTMQRRIDKHPVLAGGFKISGAAVNAVALVGVRDASHFEVAAQEGEADVWAPSGDLVARVKPGQTLSFAISQASGTTSESHVSLCGTLPKGYQIKDDFTNVTYQLQGAGLERYVGDTIQVAGTILTGNSTSTFQVVVVSKIKKLNGPCVAPAGPGAAPAVAGSEWQKGALVLLIFVAIGGTLIGLGVAGAFGVSQPAVTPTTP